MVIAEEKVLQVLDAEAAVSNSDNWPIFGLRNVRIWNPATGKTASLLEAHRTVPLVVDGQLETLPRDARHLAKQTKYQREPIRIKDVSLYSFAQRQDGSLCFWAGGRAGWYEIKSSTSKYEEVYKDMDEALSMWYYLADRYAEGAAKKKTQKVLEEFVNSQLDSRRRDGEDALEGFEEHRRFLIKCMLEGHEALDWEKMPIYRYFQKHYPEDFQAMQRLVAANEGVSEQDQEAMEIEPEKPSVKMTGKKKVKLSSKGIVTPKQRKIRQADSDDSMGDEDTSLLQTQTRSVLRPVSGRSSKKYLRHQRDIQPTTGTDADVEEDSDEEDMDMDSPSRPPQLAATQNRAALSQPDEQDLAKPVASYYEHIGAGDVWTCPYDGCNEKVWDARVAKSRELMELHFSLKHADTMTDLIMSEMRPYNNVQHLLSRVKEVASAKAVERRF